MICPTCGTNPEGFVWHTLSQCCKDAWAAQVPPLRDPAAQSQESQAVLNDWLKLTIKEFEPKPAHDPLSHFDPGPPLGRLKTKTCECGALKSKTTHVRWCPARPAQPGD